MVSFNNLLPRLNLTAQAKLAHTNLSASFPLPEEPTAVQTPHVHAYRFPRR